MNRQRGNVLVILILIVTILLIGSVYMYNARHLETTNDAYEYQATVEQETVVPSTDTNAAAAIEAFNALQNIEQPEPTEPVLEEGITE